MYEKILVPLDGSELAEVALPYAEELAGRLGSEIVLVYVMKPGSDAAEGQNHHLHEFYMQKMVESTKYSIERNFANSSEKEIKVEPVILTGDPAEQIIKYAEQEDVSLIIMATHGRSGITYWALGSVADKVARAVKRPVALIRSKGVPPDLHEDGLLHKILVPLDGSKESESVIPYIEEIAARIEAEVILSQMVAQAYHVYAGGGGGVTEIPYTDEEMQPLKTSAEDYLKRVADGLLEKGITTNTQVRVGSVAEEIIKLADEIGANLVAMSTHGRSGITRWAFGSITDRILRSGNTPVMVIRAPGAGTD
jgi:nucleotide-binding universal stress UspA family protein